MNNYTFLKRLNERITTLLFSFFFDKYISFFMFDISEHDID